MQWLHSKIAAVFVLIIVIIGFSVLSSYAVGSLAFGWGDHLGFADMDYTPVQGVGLTLLLSFLMALPYLACGMIIVFISMCSNHMSTTIIASIGLLTVAQYLSALEQVKPYSIVNQMYFFHDYFVKKPDMGMAVLSAAVILSYIVIFYLLSVTVLKKKDFVI